MVAQTLDIPLFLVRYAPERVDRLHDIVAECGVDMHRRYGLSHWFPPYPIETMRRNAQEMHVYGIHRPADDGRSEPVGTFTVGTGGWKHDDSVWSDLSHRPLYLHKLAVRPEQQGRGIGRWAVQQVERIAWEWDCQTVRFDAIARHVALIQFYRNLGYRTRGTQVVPDWRGLEWEIMYLEKVITGA